MKKILDLLAGSPFSQAAVTFVVYLLYATVIGISLTPSVFLLYQAWTVFMTDATPAGIAGFSICCGLAIYVYFITGAVVMGLVVRILSLGIKPGRYPFISLTMVRWMIYSGIYHIAASTILAYVPMSFVGNLFFRLFGARMGKNVRLNTWFLNDAYLLEIGDNVVIGGKTDISCHTIEGGKLILQRVKIGSDTLIGQRCYISPGVTIGSRCVIGQYAFVRKGAVIPDKTVIAAIAGMPIRAVARIEKGAEPPREKPRPAGEEKPGDKRGASDE